MSSILNQHLTGKRESFYKLFLKNNYIIEIPTIQRDFAQGRKSKEEVRELFLHALYDYLEENKPNRDLDFVYGSNEEIEGVTKFIPLDGQQRLTTLFLLHWYLAGLSGKEKQESFKETLSKDSKSRFTYLTRPSSAEFINALLQNPLDFNELLQPDKGLQNRLSKTIMNKGWYFLSWGYDPSISSMLTMLDAIDRKFNTNPHFYDRLTNDAYPIITFLFLDLKKFKLTEDLYIKMNSRGKPLTAFENFKAKFEQHISLLFDEAKQFMLPPGRKVSCREYFAYQIDTTWANLFWHYRHLVGKPNTYDEELMNFIRVIIANQYAIQNSEQLEHLKELVKNESATTELTENLSFYKFEIMGTLTKDCVTYLIDALDVLENDGKVINKFLEDTFYFNENDVFEKALKYTLSLPERATLHAYLKYLIINKTDRSSIHQWMRCIHNLVDNSRIEAVPELISAIKSIDQLLAHSNNILKYLAAANCRIDFFANWQVEEERLKAHLSYSETWLKLIENCEKQIFHKGQIGYLFEFAGIFEYFNKHKHVKWSSEEDEYFLAQFKFYIERSSSLFSIIDNDLSKDYLVERAILSKGIYLIPSSNSRLNFCSSKTVANYQRDYSWKRLLRLNTDDDSGDFKARRSFVRDVLTDPRFDIKNVKSSLQKICQTLPEDWRLSFVKNPGLIEYCRQGFICMTNDGEVELFRQTQLNHYHINMLVYNFFLEYKMPINQFLPFQDIIEIEVKNNEDYTFVRYIDWKFKNKNYVLDVSRRQKCYLIEFLKEKGLRKRTDYDNKLDGLLLKIGLEWHSENESFFVKKRTEKSTADCVKMICKELQTLDS